jgi:UDP-glucuronate 4-epimerase
MSTCLVTGAAGFIGSHLCEELLKQGHKVIGLDAFIPYYPREIKKQNLLWIERHPNFQFRELDLRYADLREIVYGVDVVFHLAAMPGLTASWRDFNLYQSCNLVGTQRLLEAVRENRVQHFILGSTSSVYGKVATGSEDSPLNPISPYGVTKLAAEHLCQSYAAAYKLPLTVLRFFSVYGPRQRPDMAYNLFINSFLHSQAIRIFGDGEQTRSNTYITDCIDGVMLAFQQPKISIGETFNIGGGEVVSINQVLRILRGITGLQGSTFYLAARPGDQLSTAADTTKAQRMLGYEPQTSIYEGLRSQVKWQESCLTHRIRFLAS